MKLSFLKNIKSFLILFLLIFAISFLAINWTQMSWVFDVRFLSAKISETFNDPTKDIPVDKILSAVWNKSKIQVKAAEKENTIEIPKIGIAAPLVFIPTEDQQNIENNDLKQYLDRGLVHYPTSVLPGERGQAVILGHSAPLYWPRVKYDWVFSKLNQLSRGDRIIVYYNKQAYTYQVKRTIFLNKGDELPDDGLTLHPKALGEGLTKSKYMLVLISCWPQGKDNKRIAVEASLL